MSDRQEGPGWWLASDGNWYPPESHPDVRDPFDEVLSGSVRYAGFWLRLGAFLLDALIVWIGMAFVLIVLAFIAGPLSIATLAAPWLYFAFQESSEAQATIGKRAAGIKVTDRAGTRITFGRAAGRFFGKLISAATFYIGFMMAGWTPKKQALHDMITDTLVVRA